MTVDWAPVVSALGAALVVLAVLAARTWWSRRR